MGPVGPHLVVRRERSGGRDRERPNGKGIPMRVRLGTSIILILLVVHVPASRAQDPVQELEQKLDQARPAAQDAATEEIGELPEPRRRQVPEPAADGTGLPRPSLGISVVDITELTRQRFGITVDHGAVINQVRAGYPAARAGLPLGGVIVSVNGQRIGSAKELVEVIQAYRPGEEIEVTYYEGDRRGHKKVRLTPALAPPAPPVPRAGLSRRIDPPLMLGDRQRGERPILDALERALETFVPPPDQPAGANGGDLQPPPVRMPPPPPPPAKRNAGTLPAGSDPEPPPPPPPDAAPAEAPPPALEAPAAPVPAADNELQELRQQIRTLQQQLEQLQRRLEELERKR